MLATLAPSEWQHDGNEAECGEGADEAQQRTGNGDDAGRHEHGGRNALVLLPLLSEALDGQDRTQQRDDCEHEPRKERRRHVLGEHRRHFVESGREPEHECAKRNEASADEAILVSHDFGCCYRSLMMPRSIMA
jgi:hypothetical protein